jgi:spermidine synthase
MAMPRVHTPARWSLSRGRCLLPGLLLGALTAASAPLSLDAEPAGQPAAAPAPREKERIVFDARSQWNRVLVVDRDGLRSLYFGDSNGATQSTIALADPRAVPMEYIRHTAGALAFAPRRRRALVIGLGGATFPMLLRRSFPAMSIDVVELDPMVHRVARDYFGLREDDKLRVHIADGAAFMARTQRRWDIILLDAFGTTEIPPALVTPGFFADLARSLSPGGVVIANLVDAKDARERELVGRFAKVFPSCKLQRTPRSGNLLVLGAKSPPKDMAAALQRLDRKARLPFPVAAMADLYRPCAE